MTDPYRGGKYKKIIAGVKSGKITKVKVWVVAAFLQMSARNYKE